MRLYTICHNGAKFCVQNNKKTKQLQNKRQFAKDKQNYKKNATHKKNIAVHTADITRQNFSADKKIYFQNKLTA